MPYAGSSERLGAGAVAVDDESVELLLDALHDGLIVLDDRYVMTFLDQDTAEVSPDLTRTDNDDVHVLFFSSAANLSSP